MTTDTPASPIAFECRRSCCFSDDGALLAVVRIERPAGYDVPDVVPDTDPDAENGKKHKNHRKTWKKRLPVGIEAAGRAYCERIASDCDDFAGNVLFPRIRDEYEKDTREGKRFRFVRYVYSVSFRENLLDGGSWTVIAEAKLTRGGRMLSAGIEGAVVTRDGILPPEKIRKRKSRKQGRRSGIVLPCNDGKKIGFFISPSGNITRTEIDGKKIVNKM